MLGSLMYILCACSTLDLLYPWLARAVWSSRAEQNVFRMRTFLEGPVVCRSKDTSLASLVPSVN